jgi:hypothetical protein
MASGYVTMRNQDGTQYAAIHFGTIVWASCKRDATLISQEVFEVMQAAQEESRRNDCPDRGFYGVYNLRFHPAKP